jgi:thiosulfate dehydrogenase [quinone] large subunit
MASAPPATPHLASRPTQIPEPPIARWLFADTRLAWFWLLVRLYVGWEWLYAGLEKLTDPAWTGSQSGAAITGFVDGAFQKAAGAHPDVTGWYAAFLRTVVQPNASVWAHLITYGELLVGIGLLLGLLTGAAAFFGSFMNVNYLLAGTVSSNPILFVLATWLVLAWRVAGWYGLDRWLLPWLGTPWAPGPLLAHDRPAPAPPVDDAASRSRA